jgi:hypothetical protein
MPGVKEVVRRGQRGEAYGLFGFLLKVHEYNYAGGKEGCGGEGEFRCGRHDVLYERWVVEIL